MSIESCLSSLVNNAKITQQQANDAKAIYNEYLNDDLFRDMGQGEKEAAAALRTAKFLTEDAHNAKLAVKLKVDAWRANTTRIDDHPVRPLAGHNGLYGRDPFSAGGVNLESLQDGYYKPLLASKIQEFTKAYEPKLAGLKQDTNGIRNFVREAKGVSTGDPVAKGAAGAWKAARDFADEEGKRLDPRFRPDPENVLPQYWESQRALKFKASEHKADIEREVASGGLKIFDKDTRAPAKDAADRGRIINRAVGDIRADLASFGDSSVMSDYSRTFRFANDESGAKSYLALMDKYGAGQGGYFTAMQAHMGGLARELSLKRQFGPSYDQQTQHLLAYAIKKDAERTAEPRPGTADEKMRSFLTGRVLATTLQRMATGQLSGVENKTVQAIFEGARGLVTSAKLGSALITAMPSDTWNSVMASNFRGLNSGRLVAAIARNFSGIAGAERDALAARLGIVAHAASRNAIGVKRFGDQLFGEGLFQRLGSFVVHAQGLAHWDESLKLAFPMEFLATLGDSAGKSFGELSPAFARFLKDYGFSEAEWSKIAAAQNIDAGGAKYLLPSSLDEPLRLKLLSAMADEKQFGYVVGGSMRTRAFTTFGTKAGTLEGEFLRSHFLFTNYPVTIALTHLRRAAQEASQGRFGTAAQLVIGMSIMGAMTLQAKAILGGRDPRDMSDWTFWPAAALQGGALGVYGDFMKSAFSRSDTSLTETLGLGPLATIPAAVGDLLSGARREAIEGEKVNWGSRLARFVSQMTPGSNLWYTRLLFDRFLVDSIKKELDPSYAQSFRRERDRQEKLYGQKFYWEPGELSPARAPNPAAAFKH